MKDKDLLLFSVTLSLTFHQAEGPAVPVAALEKKVMFLGRV